MDTTHLECAHRFFERRRRDYLDTEPAKVVFVARIWRICKDHHRCFVGALRQLRRERKPAFARKKYARRRNARWIGVANGEQRVISEHRPHADAYRIGSCSHVMNAPACLWTGEPRRPARRISDRAIEA